MHTREMDFGKNHMGRFHPNRKVIDKRKEKVKINNPRGGGGGVVFT